MVDEVVCNYKNCRKVIKDYAWVTNCSHIFCDEDGCREFAKSAKCPACETTVELNDSVLRVDLNPTNKCKTMLLAGYRPELVLKICARAFSFWEYQTHQAIKYQESVSHKNSVKCHELEQIFNCKKKSNLERIQILKDELTAAENEFETQLRKSNEIAESLQERNRHIQNLQAECEALQRKSICQSQFRRGQFASSSEATFGFMQCGQDALQSRFASRPSDIFFTPKPKAVFKPRSSSFTHTKRNAPVLSATFSLKPN